MNEYAHIYIIYIREVPPVGGPRKPPKEFQIPDPKTLEERQQVAQDFATELKASIPVLLDTVGDQVGKAYAAWPDRHYVIDAESKVVLKGGLGPGGFQPAVKAAPSVLDKLLGGSQ